MAIQWNHARYLITALKPRLQLDAAPPTLEAFDDRFRRILRRHLATLAWWSLLNIAAGLLGLICLQGFWYYFVMMGLVWGIINFAVTMWIFDHTVYKKFRKGLAFERLEAQRHVEKMILLNIGLDFSYFFIGLLLREHAFVSGVPYPELWMGFGWSIVLQGLYLILHDNYFYRMHSQNYQSSASLIIREILEKDA